VAEDELLVAVLGELLEDLHVVSFPSSGGPYILLPSSSLPAENRRFCAC
jgi:hypothetical protein